MNLRSYKFTPGIIPTVIFIILLPLFLRLGFWQVDRGIEKQALKEKYETDLAQQVEIAGKTVLDKIKNEKGFVLKKTGLKGNFSDQVILLENRLYKGEFGYYVFGVFHSAGHSILVNHGWIAGDLDRTRYPEPEIPNIGQLMGVLKEPPFSGIKLKETPVEKLSANIDRVQSIDIEQLEKHLSLDLYPYILRLDKGIIKSAVVDWPELSFDSDKHYGYAFQWFAFATVLVFLYIWLNLHKINYEK